MTPSTAVVRQPVETGTLARSEAIQVQALATPTARQLITPVLPAGVTYERVVSEVYFAIQNNPKLAACTPESLVLSVARAASWGLAIGEKVHLVPFSVKVKGPDGRDRWEDRAQAIRDYKGDAELVVRTGAARLVAAKCVYENEPFEYDEGTSPEIRHKPIVDPAKRGKLIAFYAWAKISTLDKVIFVISVPEVEAVRARYSKSWKSTDQKTVKLEDIPWYGMKTAVHRLTKLLATTAPVVGLIAQLEREERELEGVGDEAAVVDAAGPVLVQDAPQGRAAEIDLSDSHVEEAPARAPDPATAAAPAAGPEIDERTAAALEMLFPFPKSKDWHGKPLKDLPASYLRSMCEWIVGKQKEKGDESFHARLLEAMGLVLAHFERSQTTLPLAADDDDDLPADDSATARVSNQVDMPKGGNVADAFPPPLTVAELVARVPVLVEQLAAAGKKNDGHAAALKRAKAKDVTEQELRRMVKHLENELDTPF